MTPPGLCVFCGRSALDCLPTAGDEPFYSCPIWPFRGRWGFRLLCATLAVLSGVAWGAYCLGALVWELAWGWRQRVT